MDPNACLRLLLESIESGDRDQTVESLVDLEYWIRKGGFLPIVESTGNAYYISQYGREHHETT